MDTTLYTNVRVIDGSGEMPFDGEVLVEGDHISAVSRSSEPLTGTGAEVIEKLERMEAGGIDNVAISVTGAQGARDLIQDFGREVIAKRA